jgi:hypothetical protein
LQQRELRMVAVLLQQLTIQVKPSFAEMILVNDTLQHMQRAGQGACKLLLIETAESNQLPAWQSSSVATHMLLLQRAQMYA